MKLAALVHLCGLSLLRGHDNLPIYRASNRGPCLSKTLRKVE